MLSSALLCLALNSYFEARSEPIQGQIAVAQVVLRRAKFDERRVCRAVYKHKQFSWTAAPRRLPQNKVAWARAVYAAKVSLLWAHGAGQDYSRGATHYHTVDVCPHWERGMRLTARIGRHEFYVKRSSR